MIEIIKKSKRICEEGNELLYMSVKYPIFESCARIGEFYGTAAENAMNYCGERIADIARQSYESEKAAGIFWNRYSYVFSARVLYEGDALAVISTEAELRRGGRMIEPFRFYDIQWWEIKTGLLIPPKTALKEYAQWQKGFEKIKKKSVIFWDNGRILLDERGKKEHVGDFLPKN